MTTKLKWRLSKLPTPDELRELVKDKIITQEEAKEVLFTQEDEPDVEALKKEIEFLRKVVDELSKSRNETVEVIEKHINHYRDWTWYQPYHSFCGTTTLTVAGDNLTSGIGTTTTSTTSLSNAASSLSAISTF